VTDRPRVKICGITRRDDAELAVALGADAIGFILWPSSPRYVEPSAVSAIHAGLPPFVSRVGVFVDAPPDHVMEVVRLADLDVVQLHGSESIDAYRHVGARLVHVATLREEADVATVADWPDDVMPLVDAIDPALRGGTGRKADWNLAALLARQRPVLLAGGLDAGNVAAALKTVQPWGLDVSSGVEERPGIKSAERLREFFAAVDAARREM
jgi:phosphoribosylanthranilate isomerase